MRAREDPEYLARVRSLPCLLSGRGGCYGPVEAHHAGKRPGMGLKAADRTAVPLCRAHHVSHWHACAGAFKGWDREKRREWSDEAIRVTRALLERRMDVAIEF